MRLWNHDGLAECPSPKHTQHSDYRANSATSIYMLQAPCAGDIFSFGYSNMPHASISNSLQKRLETAVRPLLCQPIQLMHRRSECFMSYSCC